MWKEESKNAGFKFNIQETKIMAPGPIISWQTWAPKSLWMVTAAMKLEDTCSLKGKP